MRRGFLLRGRSQEASLTAAPAPKSDRGLGKYAEDAVAAGHLSVVTASMR